VKKIANKFKFKKAGLVGATALVLCLSIGAYAATNITPITAKVSWQTVVWQHIPLNVELPVGRQRIIRLPHSARIGLPASIAGDVVSQRFDGWFYLIAKAPFASHKVEIQDNETGQTILINLSASNKAPDTAINILYPTSKPSTNSQQIPGNNTQASALSGSMAYKTLTQFAEQQLYAPKRLLSNPYNIELVQSYANKDGNVPRSKWVYNLFLDGSVVAMPWAEWRGGNFYVTAVVIKNMLPLSINLTHNLVNLCGRQSGAWRAVTFFPYNTGNIWQLAPRGDQFSTTVAFLVSSNPFNQIIKSCEG
jgi:integrating conjugative element protein (TIGR03749 family)